MVEAIGFLGFFGAIVFWVVWSGLNGIIAEEKGRSGLKVGLFSLFFSPFFGYLYILAVPKK